MGRVWRFERVERERNKNEVFVKEKIYPVNIEGISCLTSVIAD